MTWYGYIAVFFVVWWLVLFTMLPFGLRTQDDDNDVVLGTTASAPRGPHMLKAVIRTTIATFILMGLYFLFTNVLGYSIDDIQQIGPALW